MEEVTLKIEVCEAPFSKKESTEPQNKEIINDAINRDSYSKCNEFFKEFVENRKKTLQQPLNLNKILNGVKVPFTCLPSINQISSFYNNYLIKERKRKYLKKGLWNERELKILLWSLALYSETNRTDIDQFTLEDWQIISNIFPSSSPYKCKIKWFSLKKSKFIKSKWQKEEDDLLLELMKETPTKPKILWSKVSIKMNQILHNNEIVRTGRHCRDRWVHHLNPKLDRSEWKHEEDLLIMKFVKLNGKKWANLSKIMKNRNEDSIRNRFIKLIKKEKLLNDGSNRNNSQNESQLVDQMISGILAQLDTGFDLTEINTKVQIEENSDYEPKKIKKIKIEKKPIKNESNHQKDDSLLSNKNQIKAESSLEIGKNTLDEKIDKNIMTNDKLFNDFLVFFEKNKELFNLFDVAIQDITTKDIKIAIDLDRLKEIYFTNSIKIESQKFFLVKKGTVEFMSELEISEKKEVTIKALKQTETIENNRNSLSNNLFRNTQNLNSFNILPPNYYQNLYFQRMNYLFQHYFMVNNQIITKKEEK